MSTELSAEVVVEEPVDPMMVKIRAEMEMSSAVRVYVDAKERYESAIQNLNESVRDVRKIIKPNTRIVIRLYYGKHYLLTSDDEGNFEVDPVDVI